MIEHPFPLTVLAIITFYPLLSSNQIRLWSLILTFILLIVTLFFPYLLKIPNSLWFKLGILIGKFISPLVTSLIFFVVIFPFAIILRILKIDLLDLKIIKD